jgi:hypothetical protein
LNVELKEDPETQGSRRTEVEETSNFIALNEVVAQVALAIFS